MNFHSLNLIINVQKFISSVLKLIISNRMCVLENYNIQIFIKFKASFYRENNFNLFFKVSVGFYYF